MIYRPLGKTGLNVSQLGFGAMRLPMTGQGADARVDRDLAVPMIHRAFAGGVNYIDTAIFYGNHDSQSAVGEALKGWRDKVVLSTKNDYYGTDEKIWWTNLENSLKRLDVPYIDIYNTHGVNWENYTNFVVPHISKWLARAKDQGLIRHICTSFHDSPEALRKIVETGFYESITVQYNMMSRQFEPQIALAHKKGLGVVVMGPVAGGNLGVDSEILGTLVPGVKRVPELALRFVLSNPGVTVALSGMSTLQQVEENLQTTAEAIKLSAADLAAIGEQMARLAELSNLYCTGCKYCMPCPQEVAIPSVLRKYNLGRVYGLWDAAKSAYAGIGQTQWDPGKPADACSECGACETKCPQKIPIMAELKKAHERLGT